MTMVSGTVLYFWWLVWCSLSYTSHGYASCLLGWEPLHCFGLQYSWLVAVKRSLFVRWFNSFETGLLFVFAALFGVSANLATLCSLRLGWALSLVCSFVPEVPSTLLVCSLCGRGHCCCFAHWVATTYSVVVYFPGSVQFVAGGFVEALHAGSGMIFVVARSWCL